MAVLPLLVLFVRRFGVARAVRWYAPAGATAAVLVLGPLAVVPQTYLDGPPAMVLMKAQSGVAHSGLIVAGVTVVVAALLSSRVRDLAGAWLAAAGALAAMTATVVATKAPALGWREAVGGYEAVAYNGAWLVLGLAGLAMTRERDAGRPSAGGAR